MNAMLIKTNGEQVKVFPKNGTDFKLPELRKLIGAAMIEVVPLPNHKQIMVVDEEGKLEGKPTNDKASELYASLDDVIVGDALVCDCRMLE
jgi:hypothetical protein